MVQLIKTYTLNANGVVNDLYELIGGFKSEAFLEVLFTRKRV